jgi:hypothetical protein
MSYSKEPVSDNVPSEEALEAGLANFKPRPSEQFYRRMATAPWLQAPRSTLAKRKPSHFYKWTIAALAGVTLCVGLATTSCGRAIADQVFKLFVYAQSDTRPLSPAELPQAAPPPQATREPNRYTQLSVSELETQFGFDIKEPTVLPDQFYLEGIFVNEKQVNFVYQFSGGGRGLIIVQQPVRNATSVEVGPAASITEVQIEGMTGEYVEGSFVIYPGAKVATWLADASTRRLRWVKDEILFEIVSGGGAAGHLGYVDQEEMIAIAEGMK